MSILRGEVNRILKKIKQGDECSKNVLFEKTYNHLKSVAYPYVRNKNDVEDVLVEAYLRIFHYIHHFDYTKDGYNWMCKIVQNTAYDFNKRYAPDVPLEDVKEEHISLNFEENLEMQDEVQYVLKDYSDRDKEMVRLRFWEDMTIEEIAEALHMSKSNVHKRISKISKEILQKKKNGVEK